MKKFLLFSSFLFILSGVKSQTINCSNFCVLNISIDTANDELDVTIFNGDTNHVNYPTVVVVNATGDTVGNIDNEFFLFAHPAGDTVVHAISTTLTSLPAGFTGTVYLTDQIWDTTCMFSYPMSCTVGVNELAQNNTFTVYPNPATDNFMVGFHKKNHDPALITIYDVTGKIMHSYTVTDKLLIINREGLLSGLYFITVVADNKRSTKKLIIK